MRLDVHRRLRDLSDKTGKEYGKLVQKLLAIAFLEAEAESVTDRCVQGIDLEVTLHGRMYAFEVKTSERGPVKFGKKDLQGLEARLDEGAEAYAAVLGAGLLDEWIFARFQAGELQTSRAYSPLQLRPYRNRELEGEIRAAFCEAVMKHAREAEINMQRGLNSVLEGYAAFRLA